MIDEPYESHTEERLVQVAKSALHRRSRGVSAMSLLALALLVTAVSAILVPGMMRTLFFGIAGVVAVTDMLLLVATIGQQRLLDNAVSEIARRRRVSLLAELRLQRLDGSGLMPAIEVTAAVLLLLVIGIAAWTAALLSIEGDPSVGLFRCGAGMLMLLFIDTACMVGLLMRAERRMRDREQRESWLS